MEPKPNQNFFGDKWQDVWEIQDDGTMVFKGPASPVFSYYIEGSRLTEKTWIPHMMRKKWVDLNTFIPAYFAALAKRGVYECSVNTLAF